MRNSYIYISSVIFGLFVVSGIFMSQNNILTKTRLSIKTSKQTSPQKIPEGFPYISNYVSKINRNIQVWSMLQDNDGIMVFAYKRGIVTFDGQNENYISFGKIPYTIKKSPNKDEIFVACSESFGQLIKDKNNKYLYKSLSENIDSDDNFYQILFSENTAFFCGEKSVISVDLNEKTKIETVFSSDSSIQHTGQMLFNKKILLFVPKKGFYDIFSKDYVFPENFDLLESKELTFSIPFNKNVILGTATGELYVFDGNSISNFEITAQDYLNESIVTGALDLNSQQFIVYTLNGGALIIDKETKETVHTINYRTGLPDDEVFSAALDRDNGLWLSHEYGISRVAFEIPLRNYSNYPGLEGKINSIAKSDSILYIATGEGVYYLSEIKDYKEIEVVIRKKYSSKNKSNNTQTKTKEEQIENTFNNEQYDDFEEESESNEKIGIVKRWSKWRKKRKNKREEKNEEEQTDTNIEEKSDKPDTDIKDRKTPKTEKYKRKIYDQKKKIYELQSVKYAYKKVENINEKCKQISQFDNGFLVASNSGLYFLFNKEAKEIIKDIYVHQIITENNKSAFIASSDGIYRIASKDNKLTATKIEHNLISEQKIYSLANDKNGSLWAGSDNTVFNIMFSGNTVKAISEYEIETNFPEKIEVKQTADRILFFLSEEVYTYNTSKDSIEFEKELTSDFAHTGNVFFPNNELFVILNGKKIIYEENAKKYFKGIEYLKLFSNTKNIFLDDDQNMWLVSGNNKLHKILQQKGIQNTNFILNITDIVSQAKDTLQIDKRNKLNYDYKSLVIKLSAPYYLKYSAVKYYYYIDKHTDNLFSSNEPVFNIPVLATGNHTISFYAEDALNRKSNIHILHLKIIPPLWKVPAFQYSVFGIILLLLSGIILGIAKKRKRILEKRNIELEEKVKKRTERIVAQNNHIKLQNTEIQETNKKILLKNNEINNKNKEISDQHRKIKESIRYASKIQKAVLPYTDVLRNYIKNNFILYLPRDVVSGDFYWVQELNDKLYIVAADCTGHGVPGGFLSMLGISFLNEIVNNENVTKKFSKASDILNELREKVTFTLRRSEDYSARDGMDISIVIIDKENMELQFSGAHNPIFFVRNNEVTEIKADRMPIGLHRKPTPFTNHILEIKDNDLIYMFSDGYADQFGGPSNRKFSKYRLQNLITTIGSETMAKQKAVFREIYNKWKGDYKQIDDVLLIGLRI